ncbi:MAG: ImmA/IrrE family metallo-endopeptidase [Clavibacter sp.]|nr:ImmA/IrrE family metallo-endopeptidase [Clavibacter sp.]OQJ49505.1 DNA-binding protein [Clavibacter sepedonicus]OQJ55390.1 DNA-binding protein [Clavibacter sepedonicus]
MPASSCPRSAALCTFDPSRERGTVVTHVPVRPEMIGWALERSRMDPESAKYPQFRRWADGDGAPTFRQLETFARAAHVPLGYLFLPRPPREEVPIPDLRTIRDAGVRKPSPELLDTIHLAQRRQDWFRDHARDRGQQELPFVGSVNRDTDPLAVAADIRSRLGFTVEARRRGDALRTAIDLVEGLGVLVMVSGIVGSNTHRKLTIDEFRGFALTDPRAPVVFVNGVDAKTAQLFTLMHELAHIWAGQSALSDIEFDSPAVHAEERWANAVAAEVLVPRADLERAYSGDAKDPSIELLTKRYRVSALVVLHRLFDTGLLPWDEFRRRYVTEEIRGRELADLEVASRSDGGNYYNTHLRHIGHAFARGVIVDTMEGRTLYRDAFRLLDTRKHATFTEMAERLGVA